MSFAGDTGPKPKGHRVPIAERRAPAPDHRAGFIRIDSVHQGDQDGVKGLYHINAVDGVTQFEIVATRERISEAYLLPVNVALIYGPSTPCSKAFRFKFWAFTQTTARSTSITQA